MSQEISTERIIARGREAFERGAYVSALEDFQESLRREPGFADVYNLSGLCYGLVGRPEAALEAFDQALDINPGYVEALLNRAITLGELGRVEEAREAFERAAGADESEGPYPATVAAPLAHQHERLGDLYRAAEDLDQALAQYERAVELRPSFLDIRNKRVRVLIDLGSSEEAERELHRILEINPSYSAARANLGLALFKQNRIVEAEEAWRQCLRQRPDDAQVQAYVAMIERSRPPSS